METLKKEIRSLKAQLKYKEGARRAGFAMFYAEEERNFNMMFSHENKMRTILKNAVGENSIPKHIENELKELYEETKKVIECPICLDIINREDLTLSSCGHKYHKECYKELLEKDGKCAMCRRKIYAKKD
tara:strand:- start:5269 stop:5658 length:390 start_codon:yes stop_codon:yes gene_type:complete